MITALGFASTFTFPSNTKAKQRKKEKLTLNSFLGCKDPLELESTMITTPLSLKLGFDTVYSSSRMKIHKFDDEIEGKLIGVDYVLP